eukprot:TRINITY_DN25280_c2_g5_i1.p1 TRINITY_DN25280_c2_g5~~TRINITY_DN25280_c2_g5_i1.p1  ORF type:complete len:885 (+),score=124.40 TRINITY_DN25280_c2_g5_i1:28-2682(+)
MKLSGSRCFWPVCRMTRAALHARMARRLSRLLLVLAPVLDVTSSFLFDAGYFGSSEVAASVGEDPAKSAVATTTSAAAASTLLNASAESAPTMGSGNATTGGVATVDQCAAWLQLSVIRIRSISMEFDYLLPHSHGEETQAVGSGFSVKMPDVDLGQGPVFITNAHVVRNAHTVKVQVPAIGQQEFDAYVPVIYTDMDLAVVKLVEPSDFETFMKQSKVSLHTLQIRPVTVELGEEVVAVGFPLGSSTLKLSSGVVAGTENIDSRLVYQSTAPISPGSSGGPLFKYVDSAKCDAVYKQEGPEIVGVNFAASTGKGAQNANYVVPHVHIMQILNAFSKQLAMEKAAPKANAPSPASPETPGLASDEMRAFVSKKGEKRMHNQLHVAPLSPVIVETNDALYKSSGGCTSGIYVAHIHPPSALLEADILADSFITAVDGVRIDSFGYGRTADFLQNPIPFESMLKFRPNLETNVQVTTCRGGTIENHSVRMEFRDSLNFGIKNIAEPYYQRADLEFEFFGDIMVMQMTRNHVIEIMQRQPTSAVTRWLVPRQRKKAHLMIVFVTPGSYADRVLEPGMVVQKINDRPVSTLAQWRNAEIFDPSGSFWKLQTDLGIVYKTEYIPALERQLAIGTSNPMRAFMITDGFKSAFKRKVPNGVATKQHESPGEEVSIAQKEAAKNSTDAANSAATIARNLVAKVLPTPKIFKPRKSAGLSGVAKPATSEQAVRPLPKPKAPVASAKSRPPPQEAAGTSAARAPSVPAGLPPGKEHPKNHPSTLDVTAATAGTSAVADSPGTTVGADVGAQDVEEVPRSGSVLETGTQTIQTMTPQQVVPPPADPGNEGAAGASVVDGGVDSNQGGVASGEQTIGRTNVPRRKLLPDQDGIALL